MERIEPSPRYRPDIDGLRAIAVVVVILFHFGYFPHGYLGVDVFFVISGFLITGIIHRGIEKGSFSTVGFYARRTRRIIPLVLVVCFAALVVGMVVMLPDDLENLAQSVIATNLFANNVLQAITTRDYWDIVNEFKPLMHTWSLGVEEQYYLLYPIGFVLLGRARLRFAVWGLAALALGSLAIFVTTDDPAAKFYYLTCRFFELATGGVTAILLRHRLIRHRMGPALLAVLILLLSVDLPLLSDDLRLILVVAVTTALLASANHLPGSGTGILTLDGAVAIGKISFSLYMWHQVLLAFARYTVAPHPSIAVLGVVAALTLGLSVLTYHFIEQPFRDPSRVATAWLAAFLVLGLGTTTGASWWLYRSGGLVRPVPELGLTMGDAGSGIHARYNDRIHDLNRPFATEASAPLRVLVVGNSFGRDWANVLLESRFGDRLEVSYTTSLADDPGGRVAAADVIFLESRSREEVEDLGEARSKVWVVGTKNFGLSNGVFYNRRGSEDYCDQRATPEDGYVESNVEAASAVGDRYFDLMGEVLDGEGRVPVFTDDCRFISQDTRHFTQAGAQFFARLFDEQIGRALGLPQPQDR